MSFTIQWERYPVAVITKHCEALSRERFAKRVVRELEELRKDEKAWAAYLDEVEATHLTDGIS